MTTPIPIRERDWQRTVIEAAQALNWTVAHFRAARTLDGSWRTPVAADGAGFPDLVLVRDGHLLFMELKSEKGKPTDHQQAWLHDLRDIAIFAGQGIQVLMLRPSDMPRIREMLT